MPGEDAPRAADVASAWAPLRLFPIFRALWIAQFASNVGTWMQTVGAQWLLVDRSPLLVAAAVLAVGLVVGLRSPMPDTTRLDRAPSAHWPPRSWSSRPTAPTTPTGASAPGRRHTAPRPCR
jgi:hypothetical protein